MPSGDDLYPPSTHPTATTALSEVLRRPIASGQPPATISPLGAPASPGLLAHGIRSLAFATSGATTRNDTHHLGGWTFGDGRSALATSAALDCDASTAVASTSPSASTDTDRTPPAASSAADATPRRPSIVQAKRSSDEAAFLPGIRSSPSKKARTRLVPSSDIDLGARPKALAAPAASRNGGAPSTLFASSSTRSMSGRHPPYPPSDAAAALLARLRDDGEGVHTVRLPRGNVSSARGPPRTGSTPGSGSWSSIDAAATATTTTRSPDSRTLPPSLQMLNGVGVIELLEQDERPTFIIDIAGSVNPGRPGLHILYANASLRASTRVLELLTVDGERVEVKEEFTRFTAWATSFIKDDESLDVCLPSVSYGGITWTCSTLRKRFRFVSGSSSAVSTTPASPSPLAQEAAVLEQRSRGPTPSFQPGTPMISESDYFGDLERRRSESLQTADGLLMDEDTERHHTDEFTQQVFQGIKPSFDWTRIHVTPDLNEHILFARTVDWASTPLGPIEDWGADLRAMANLVMGSPHPAAMYWGPENTAIYNEAYIDLAGKKHPMLMGMPYKVIWAEIWDDISSTLQAAWDAGQSTMKNDNQLFINRHGYLEETFFSWSIVPLVGSDGQVVGLYNPAFENTRRKINERRMLTLREIGEKTAAARDVRAFWPAVKAGLEYNDVDVPFALIYSVREDLDSEVSSMHSGSISNPPVITLEGSLGAPPGHHAAVPTLDLRVSDDGFAPYMRQSLTMHGEPIVLTTEAGTLPLSLIDGLEWRGFGDPCKTLVVFPVHPTTAGESVVGFIVMGVNPRRPYDDDYQLFIHLLSRQMATSMASVVLFEEEIKRGQRAARLAAMDRQELSMQLYLRTQEAVESEYKFTRMAEFAPVGMFMANGQGLINFANDMWWQISRHPRSEDGVNTWIDSVRDEDRLGVEQVWRKLVHDKVAITHEFRFKCSKQNGDHTMDTWVLMSAFPEKEDGSVKSIFGCMTDISTQKWAEDFQKQRREEAVELKRQQENFIDITSHEMRNPLSAILQCADEIANSITEFREHDNDPKDLAHLLEGCFDAANTINLCASHQKRIVDDILTLSKLDSQLLLVAPVLAHPITIVQHVLKMFESELNTHEIQLEFRIEQPYHDHAVNWVKLDPSRLQQVLINLMTNAIKFTQSRETRQIILSMSASRDISEVTETGLFYFPSRRDDLKDLTSEKEWGTGDEYNLHFSVQDTGPGLREEEKKILFQRFSQASPRTHVQYGGSGLGLFISRILTELQGGQIGVTSEKGVGSNFAFYVKCRKSDAPHPDSDIITGPNLARASRTGKSSPLSSTPPPARVSRRASYRRHPHVGGPPPLDVLIVEDNLVNQMVLQKQLRNIGNNTYVANHGGEALDTIRKSRYWIGQETSGIEISVILMDLEMPVMDGMTCARRIRQLEREGIIVRHLPIIAVTAYARPEQIENAKAAGIDDVISKPFRIPELIPKIEELLAKYGMMSTIGGA